LPDGDTRTSVFFEPYPIYRVREEGCYIFDVGGNKYIDLMNNYSSLIHGHNHPKVREAVAKQLECGTIFGAPIKVNISCLKFYSIEFHLSKR